MSEPEASGSPDSFPEILETGSMLKLAAELAEEVPERLGAYRVLKQIGAGGMGVVYLAEQDPPLVRRVAIKLARNAVAGDRALARFESERQTLAVMNHANIARVFDAGSAPDSRPFFVMEYVAGESITDYCDARRLGIEARLELFLGVCDGVQHAHLNAVLHRDLKPANILVTTEGDQPIPKIIDFGVAKALGGVAEPSNGLTQFGQVVGTPEYMSPEQAALDGRAVDSRTDVYSLGVVLYELLAGARPFEREAGPDGSLVDLCRRIREEEPERPSLRALSATSVDSECRLQPSPVALARRLRGDLDAIAIKALSKDPQSRYASPSDMAADIQRHLHHLPIYARPPGLLVRMRKGYLRHRAAVWVGGVLSAMLIGLAIAGTAQALRARRESARAETEARVGNEIRKFIIHVIDPPATMTITQLAGASITGPDRDMLLDRVREQFADQPVLQSQLLFVLAKHSIVSTHFERYVDTLVESRNRITSLLGPDSPESIATNENLALAYLNFKRFSEAEAVLLDSLERRRRLGGIDDLDTWRTTAGLANLYKRWLRHDQAAPLFEAAIAGLTRRLGPDHPDVLASKVALSGSYLELHRYQEAQLLLEGANDDIRRVFGDRDYQSKVALYNLACAQANLGRIEVAFDYLHQSITRGWSYPVRLARDAHLLPLHGDPRFDELERESRMNEIHHWAGYVHDAETWIREGRFADAERLLSALVVGVERFEGNGAGGWLDARLALAKCWIYQKRFDEAERLLLATHAVAKSAVRPDHHIATLELLAQCAIGLGQLDSALERIAAAEAMRHPVFENVEKYYAAAQSQALRHLDDEALRTLARASELGFDDADQLEHDLAFVRLRDRPEFHAIAKSARQRAFDPLPHAGRLDVAGRKPL